MTNILLSGCNGKMGQVISRLAVEFAGVEIVAGVDVNNNLSNYYPAFKSIDEVDKSIKFDVIIDFSHPSSFEPLMKYCSENCAPIVVATTGLSEEQKSKMQEYKEKFPLFFTANMSLGINLIMDLAKKAAKVLEGNFDIEIMEKHHNKKIDAPSGTALAIADEINSVLTEKCDYVFDRSSRREKRTQSEIGIHAIRGGTIVGEHSIIFAGTDEVVEIKHSANSKEIFGIGALKAAVFMHGKSQSPGLYNMNDLIGCLNP